MNTSKKNILGLFVKIIDAEKCYKNLNNNNDTNNLWTNQWLRNKSGESEWEKYKYLPQNEHVGEIVAKLNTEELLKEPIYIIRTFGMFYVPICKSGFEKIDVVQIR